MPAMGLSRADVDAVIAYIDEQSASAAGGTSAPQAALAPGNAMIGRLGGCVASYRTR